MGSCGRTSTTSKTRLALGVILLALVWPVAEPIAGRPSQPAALLLLGLGAALLVTSQRPGSMGFRRLGAAGALAAGALALVLGAGSAGPARAVCVAAGALASTDLVPRLQESRLGRGLAAAGAVVLACGVSSLALMRVGWRLHDIPITFPRWLSRWFVEGLLGGPGPAGGLLPIWTGERLETVRISCEALGIYILWFGLAAATAAAMLCGTWGGARRVARALALGAVVVVGYACLRLSALAVLAIEFNQPRLLWASTYTVMSWLPLAFALGPLIPQSPRSPTAPERAAPRAWAVCALAVAGILAGAALGYNDAGNLKPGRVLFDNSRADWEWFDEPFDTTSFGIRAEYNYYCLRDLLGHFYEVTALASGSLEASALDRVDVLVIRTPTKPYGQAEIQAIVEFVERGGGLLLIGDHTNLFGMSTYLNAIAVRFGMRFRLDDTFDLETTGLSAYARPGVWFHPAVRDLDRFQFLTSCTVEGDLLTEPVIVGSALGSEEVDYGHPNFFGNIAFDLRDRFGIFLQAAAKRWGRGRVMLFTDSTCFSNFCMASPGTPDLALGFIDYLNRSGTRWPRLRLAAVLAAAGVIGALCLSRRSRASALSPGGGLGLAAGLVAGVLAASHLNAAAYGRAEARLPVPVVLFESRHTEASFNDHLGAGPGPRSHRFEELYMCAERVGLHPRCGALGDLDRTRPRAVVIANPVRPFDRHELEHLSLYVEGGGVLVLLDSVTNPRSSANQVLARFGVEVAVATRTLAAPPAPPATEFYPALEVHGIEARDRGARSLAKTVGLGRVIIAPDAFRYSAAVLGQPLSRALPSEPIRDVYREVFALLDAAAKP